MIKVFDKIYLQQTKLLSSPFDSALLGESLVDPLVQKIMYL